MLAGGAAALLLVAAGLFWWQGRASTQAAPAALIAPAPPAEIEGLPEGDPDAVGLAPPEMPAEASAKSREQRRFDRYDRNRDGAITRIEMMGSRTKAFKALDKDGDNLLSFEEWAVATSDRFGAADADKDGKLTRAEFAATAPKLAAKAKCKC
jgi:hypothetical protein